MVSQNGEWPSKEIVMELFHDKDYYQTLLLDDTIIFLSQPPSKPDSHKQQDDHLVLEPAPIPTALTSVTRVNVHAYAPSLG